MSTVPQLGCSTRTCSFPSQTPCDVPAAPRRRGYDDNPHPRPSRGFCDLPSRGRPACPDLSTRPSVTPHAPPPCEGSDGPAPRARTPADRAQCSLTSASTSSSLVTRSDGLSWTLEGSDRIPRTGTASACAGRRSDNRAVTRRTGCRGTEAMSSRRVRPCTSGNVRFSALMWVKRVRPQAAVGRTTVGGTKLGAKVVRIAADDVSPLQLPASPGGPAPSFGVLVLGAAPPNAVNLAASTGETHRVEGRNRSGWATGDEFGHQRGSRSSETESEHVVSGRHDDALGSGRAADERLAVGRHGARPHLLVRAGAPVDPGQVGRRLALHDVDAPGVQSFRGPVELDHADQPRPVTHGRHPHMRVAEPQHVRRWVIGMDREAVALAGGHVTADPERPEQLLGPGARGDVGTAGLHHARGGRELDPGPALSHRPNRRVAHDAYAPCDQ